MGVNSILLIDDESNYSISLSTALSNYNLKVHHAKSLNEGLTLFAETRPVVVIFGASVTAGFSLSQSLKYARSLKNLVRDIKIIFIIKKAFKQTVVDVFNSGSITLLSCPLSFSRLIKEVIRDETSIQKAIGTNISGVKNHRSYLTSRRNQSIALLREAINKATAKS